MKNYFKTIETPWKVQIKHKENTPEVLILDSATLSLFACYPLLCGISMKSLLIIGLFSIGFAI